MGLLSKVSAFDCSCCDHEPVRDEDTFCVGLLSKVHLFMVVVNITFRLGSLRMV